ncbi:ion transport protein [Babesia ovis]|uniref:Ion transport protein n=1 Tax=Babesia ovis TaxID=5869 RepID=A0A9W5WVX9_BABOV|nr:ion transport protein [Babesia ovis]
MVEDSQAGLTSSLRDVTEQLFEIATGMQFQVYKLEFPRCFYGMTFVEICHYLYKAKNMFLLGLVSNNSCILNPVFETIGVEGEGDVYYGLVLAKSLMDVHHVSLLQNPNLEPFKYEFDGYKTDVSLEVSNCIPENHGETNEENKHPSVTPLNGIYKVDGYEDAMSLFSRPQLQLILVCGWVVDMHRFLTSLLVDNNTNVICLAPLDLVEGIGSLPLSSFRHAVVYMDGSAMDINTLVTAGVLQATCIVVLNSEQSALASNKRHLSKDSQVLFVRHLVKHIDVTHSRQSRPVHIIMDIQHSSCLEYLDPSLVSSMDASCKRHAMNRLWQNFGEFMTSYEMASGTIFVQDMLYGLLAHSYVPSSNSVGYDTIQKLLDNGSTIRNRISLERIPAKFNHETFKSLFIHHISVEHKICIGILRTYQDPLNSEFKQLILVAPQPSFNLHPDDEVYVVEPNVVSK